MKIVLIQIKPVSVCGIPVDSRSVLYCKATKECYYNRVLKELILSADHLRLLIFPTVFNKLKSLCNIGDSVILKEAGIKKPDAKIFNPALKFNPKAQKAIAVKDNGVISRGRVIYQGLSSYYSVIMRKIGSEFFKFIAVGVFSTVINYTVFYLLVLTGINYLPASGVGFMCGVLVGYPMNRKWTFRKTNGNKFLSGYCVVYIISLLISLLFLKVTAGIMGFDPRLCNIASILITTIINFIGTKLIIFR